MSPVNGTPYQTLPGNCYQATRSSLGRFLNVSAIMNRAMFIRLYLFELEIICFSNKCKFGVFLIDLVYTKFRPILFKCRRSI